VREFVTLGLAHVRRQINLPRPDGWREIVKARIALRLPDWRAYLLETAILTHGRVSQTGTEAADVQALGDETPVRTAVEKSATVAAG
jgi:hypothetical protein